MLYVMDLAFQGIQVREGENLRVRDLMDGQAGQVIHDRASQLSLVVDPDQVATLANSFGLDADSPLAESPIVPYLAYGQMTAHQFMPALAVLSLAEWQNLGYIVVESDGHRPVGLVGTAYVRGALERAHAVVDAGLVGDVSTALGRGGLSVAIDVLDDYFQPGQFHSESLNETPHPAARCLGGGGGGHYLDSCPCRAHPGVDCG
ncbi:hypothetical protein JNN96_34855 [Mycobacterium sp. DSM 3803]|nr:hypothetical protein [Mycobacterium sp. DSM 3803]